ncbi:hypothetical protein FIBSPDRAFT_1051376 [Athelia psychrophila]|uniref:Uncharacterized protein n=1 Tax=Athelia psychrophila TaxID=1759441 RepID=A0A165ZA05_9AGAM|nr:hypothetical protein FIBSPDRAFT_1051376 [Fibularhizoctonia sp. CBS 109695]
MHGRGSVYWGRSRGSWMYHRPLLSPTSLTLKLQKTKRRTLLSSPALCSALNPEPGPEALLFSTSNAPSSIGSCRNACAALEESGNKEERDPANIEPFSPPFCVDSIGCGGVACNQGSITYPEAWELADPAPAQTQDRGGDDNDDQYGDEHDDDQDQEHDPDNHAEGASAYGSFIAFLPRPPTPGTTYTALVVPLSTFSPSSFWQSQVSQLNFPFAAARVLTVCAFSTNSYRGEIHASRFDGALRGPESDSINSAGLGVVVDLLVVIFSAFGEAEVQGVPGMRSPQWFDLRFF